VRKFRMNSEIFLKVQIQTQRGNMRLSLAFSVALLLLGILVTLWFLLRPGSDKAYPDLMKLGPMFITSAVAAVPLKAFLSYRTRIATYVFLLGSCSDPDPAVSQMVMEAMKNLLKVE
jgi:hypothetical protein